MKSKIILCADIHLRTRQFNRDDRGNDFQNAFNQVVDIAIEEEADAILVAGDLLDNNRPSSATIQFLGRINARLQDAKILMIIVHGDHDKTDPHWASLLTSEDTPYGIRVLENETITLPGTETTVHGMDFIGKTKERFLEMAGGLPRADILLWHTMVKEFAGFYGEASVSLAELPTDKYQVIALGDIHVCEHKVVNGCWVGYPGSTELCKGNEPLQKSVTVLEFDIHNKFAGSRTRELKTRKTFVYRLNQQSDVDAALLELEAAKHLNPMVFARYNPVMENVVARFYAVLDPDKAIIRMAPIETETLPQLEHPEEEKPLEAFLTEFLTPGTEIYDTALACMRPEAPVAELLGAYVERHNL